METDTYWRFRNLRYIEECFRASNPRIPLGRGKGFDSFLFFANVKYFVQAHSQSESGRMRRK